MNDYSKPEGNKLQTLQDLLQKSGDPKSRPAGWFLDSGTKKITQPQQGGGKWLCTMLLKKRVINQKQFYLLARCHALMILFRPNFAYWYLRFMGSIVERAEREGHNWKNFQSEHMEKVLREHGFETAFYAYSGYCLGLWAMYGRDLPHPDQMRFGRIKLLASSWFWGAIPNFLKYQWRLYGYNTHQSCR